MRKNGCEVLTCSACGVGRADTTNFYPRRLLHGRLLRGPAGGRLCRLRRRGGGSAAGVQGDRRVS